MSEEGPDKSLLSLLRWKAGTPACGLWAISADDFMNMSELHKMAVTRVAPRSTCNIVRYAGHIYIYRVQKRPHCGRMIGIMLEDLDRERRSTLCTPTHCSNHTRNILSQGSSHQTRHKEALGFTPRSPIQ